VAATVVCPDAGRAGTTIGATAPGAEVTGGPLGAPAGVLPPVLSGLPDGAHVLTARGAGAGGLLVEQRTRTASGPGRGASALVCPAPAAAAWFVGGATTVGTSSELVLVNVEDVPAVVDLRVWTADGPADLRPGRATVVPARSRVVVPVDRLAPDRDLLALHVDAVRGRVASALRVVRADGRTPLGTDWVPAGLPPARELVVPGLTAGPGRRTALLTNPGQDDAVVRLELVTGDGSTVPDGGEAVSVPAGTSVAVDLSAALATTRAALRVTSDGAPVLAGALLVDGDGAARDAAWAAATPPLAGVVQLPAPPPAPKATLLLSAPAGDAVVQLGGARVEVPSGTTVEVPLTAATSLRVLTGPVHAARWAVEAGARGPLTTLLPVLPARLDVRRPVVLPAR
jgi:hypothetical protein